MPPHTMFGLSTISQQRIVLFYTDQLPWFHHVSHYLLFHPMPLLLTTGMSSAMPKHEHPSAGPACG